MISTFIIHLKSKRKIADIVKSGRYDEVNFLVHEGIRKERIRIQDPTPGDRTMVLLSFDVPISTQDVKLFAQRRRLIAPTHEDIFLFGEQHPEEQRKGKIVFFCESQYLWSGHLFDFVLSSNKTKRKVSLVSSGGDWPENCKFAFRTTGITINN